MLCSDFWYQIMAVIEVSCRYCLHTETIQKFGKSKRGCQRYHCTNCDKTFQLQYINNACKPGVKEQIIDMAMNNSGIKDTARVLQISKNTVLAVLKN